MSKKTESQIKESYNHIETYLKDLETTSELRKMCENCENYCGAQHDYEECKDKQCFRFWLCYKYLEWSNSF